MPHDLTVIVASHKSYWMPDDPVYRPVWVNAAANGECIPEGWLRDDADDNISSKNANYCELTALYWAWKNLKADYLGLSHYRRYFASSNGGEKRSRIASGDNLRAVLMAAPVILPTKRNYYIETNYSQYVHAHHEEDLTQTRTILQELHPEYISAYDDSMQRTAGHRFNMFVMRRDLMDAYCEWLFDVLFELERRLDISSYSVNDARVFGFVSERLLDPWIETNGIEYAEMPVVNLENQHWMKKGASFLRRKFAGGH